MTSQGVRPLGLASINYNHKSAPGLRNGSPIDKHTNKCEFCHQERKAEAVVVAEFVEVAVKGHPFVQYHESHFTTIAGTVAPNNCCIEQPICLNKK